MTGYSEFYRLALEFRKAKGLGEAAAAYAELEKYMQTLLDVIATLERTNHDLIHAVTTVTERLIATKGDEGQEPATD